MQEPGAKNRRSLQRRKEGVIIKTRNGRLLWDWLPWAIGDLQPRDSQPDLTWGINTQASLPLMSWEALQWLNQKPEGKESPGNIAYGSVRGTEQVQGWFDGQMVSSQCNHSLLSLFAFHSSGLSPSFTDSFLTRAYPFFLTHTILPILGHVPSGMLAFQFLDQYFSNHPFFPSPTSLPLLQSNGELVIGRNCTVFDILNLTQFCNHLPS